jgi:hypothetical protein
MDTKNYPVSVDLPAGTVVNVTNAAATALQTDLKGVKAVQVDLPATFTGGVHAYCQAKTNADPALAEVRKMTQYKYANNLPLQFAIGEATELLLATDSGTGGTIPVMVTLWVE